MYSVRCHCGRVFYLGKNLGAAKNAAYKNNITEIKSSKTNKTLHFARGFGNLWWWFNMKGEME